MLSLPYLQFFPLLQSCSTYGEHVKQWQHVLILSHLAITVIWQVYSVNTVERVEYQLDIVTNHVSSKVGKLHLGGKLSGILLPIYSCREICGEAINLLKPDCIEKFVKRKDITNMQFR